MFLAKQILSHYFFFGLGHVSVTFKLHVTYLKEIWKAILELVMWKTVSFITFEEKSQILTRAFCLLFLICF